jgi:uncharacterized SAM-dependent methyltransferase
MGQFHWDPESYLAMMREEVPAFERLQDAATEATGTGAARILELGTGTGETARRVLADVVVPDDPADVVTPIDGVYDVPSTVAEQLAWMREASLDAGVAWLERDLAVLVGRG